MEAFEFNKVTPSVVADLRRICGDRHVIYEEKDALANYASDESGKYYSHMPEAAIKPSSAQEISEIMKLANRERIPVTPRGAGSGIAGAAVPIYGGIVLSFERLDKVIEIDRANMAAVVEPGVITNDLCKMVQEQGLYYAGYPMSVETSTIGGNIAVNAGGGTVIKYGNTGHHVLGLEVVLPTGEIMMLGGKRKKDTNGYNMVQLMVGSEGTLAIVTKAILNLLPQPGPRASLLVAFAGLKEAIAAVPDVIISAKTLPVSLELLDKLSVEITSKFLNDNLPMQESAGAYLLIQLEGTTQEELEGLYEPVAEACLNREALDVFVADDRRKSERVWKFRASFLEAYKSLDPYVYGEECVVPMAAIPRVSEKVVEVAAKYKTLCTVCGHIGDGNLHMALFKPSDVAVGQWPGIMERMLLEIYEEVKMLGGAVSGEHGVGFIKLPFERAMRRQEEFDLMRRIKQAFDPNHILNPGKIF